MKKLLMGLTLASMSFPLLAEDITLPATHQLSATSISYIHLEEGDHFSNLWLAIDPAQIPAHVEKQLSNCILTAQMGLDQGAFFFSSDSLRCIGLTGDVYTAEGVKAQFLSGESLCAATDTQGRCTEVTLEARREYFLSIDQDTRLKAAYNPAREVNRLRLQEQMRQ